MIHVDPAFLRKYPIFGVILGLVLAAVGTAFLLGPGMDETRDLLRQKTPATVSVQEAIRLPGVRWITVAGGTLRCADAIRLVRKDMVGRMLFGRIQATEVPFAGEAPNELLVAVFDGDKGCPQGPLSGVIGSIEVFGNSATRQRWNAPGMRVVPLDVDASPWKALEMALGIGGLIVVGVLAAGYYMRVMLRRRELS